jgi:NADH:ubiquinone oxidoreductase subunit 6 (subunit J)
VSYEITLILGTMLVSVTFVALIIRRLVWSLILLFYSSIVFGLLLMTYGATFAGLFHIITFAGAVSVLFMVILMLVGGPALSRTDKLGPENYFGIILAVLAAIPLIVLVSNFQPLANMITEQAQLAHVPAQPDTAIAFLWRMRAWDLLLFVVLVAAAMLGIMNLFSREGGGER